MFLRVPPTELPLPFWRRWLPRRPAGTAIDPETLTDHLRRDLGFADGPPGPRRGGGDPTPPLRFPSW